MTHIPVNPENPNGLQWRYRIQKVLLTTESRPSVGDYNKHRPETSEKVTYVDVDPESEYFVMRLDEGGKDREHIKACRIGINAYADAIEHHLPELAKDLRERYPLLP